MFLNVKVTPKARENRVVGFENDVLKVKVTAAPEKGAANHAVVQLLSKYFDIPQRDFILLRGESSRLKTFRIDGEHSLKPKKQ